MKRVFLGGTCNESTWRNRMMCYLYSDGLEYFNPVVDDWDDTAQSTELKERKECDFCLYTITPKMTGVYSIAEVVDDSNKRPDRTILVLLRDDGEERFTIGQWKSLGAVARMVKSNGAQVFDDLKSASIYMSKNGGGGWKMKDERFKELMEQVGMPDSSSLLSALQQVANEVAQEKYETINAMDTLRQAMKADPDYAHSWHCNIAIMCYDAIGAAREKVPGATADDTQAHIDAHSVGNDAASRFMELCFDVETKQ